MNCEYVMDLRNSDIDIDRIYILMNFKATEQTIYTQLIYGLKEIGF